MYAANRQKSWSIDREDGETDHDDMGATVLFVGVEFGYRSPTSVLAKKIWS